MDLTPSGLLVNGVLTAPLVSLAFIGSVSFAGASVTGLNDKQDKLTATTDVTAGVGTFKYIACTATSGRPITPSGYGALLGCDGTDYCALELSCDLMPYIDFTSPGVDAKGRFLYLHPSSTFQWIAEGILRMSLSPINRLNGKWDNSFQ